MEGRLNPSFRTWEITFIYRRLYALDVIFLTLLKSGV